jgi:ABC-type multidrug transport system fused ATPase/permease subunit
MLFSLNFYIEKNEDIEISSLSSSIQLVRSMAFPIHAIPAFLNMIFSNILSIERLQNFLYGIEHKENKYKNKESLDKNNLLIKFDKTTFGIKDNIIKEENENNIDINKEKNNLMNKKENNGIKEELELKEIFSDNKEKLINEEIKLDIKTLEKNVKEKQINRDIILLKDISIEINKGEFVIILGPTGSGKSSLFNAMLNNCHIYSTQSKPIINGEFSYYSQQPWIISDTLKNNILFFKPLDLEKYLKIIKICQLEKDLELLPYGEETEINSTSSNVSGGQRARISLARTLYKDADLYLIDDPFASIDNKVGTQIFKEVFCGFLKNKTRILITNEMEGLSHADKIIYMEKGKIIFCGKYEEFHEKFGIKNLHDNNIDSDHENKYNEEEKNVRRFIRKYSAMKEEENNNGNKDHNNNNIIKENNFMNGSNKSLNKKMMKQNFENNPLRLLEKEKKGKTIDF